MQRVVHVLIVFSVKIEIAFRQKTTECWQRSATCSLPISEFLPPPGFLIRLEKRNNDQPFRILNFHTRNLQVHFLEHGGVRGDLGQACGSPPGRDRHHLRGVQGLLPLPQQPRRLPDRHEDVHARRQGHLRGGILQVSAIFFLLRNSVFYFRERPLPPLFSSEC